MFNLYSFFFRKFSKPERRSSIWRRLSICFRRHPSHEMAKNWTTNSRCPNSQVPNSLPDYTGVIWIPDTQFIKAYLSVIQMPHMIQIPDIYSGNWIIIIIRYYLLHSLIIKYLQTVLMLYNERLTWHTCEQFVSVIRHWSRDHLHLTPATGTQKITGLAFIYIEAMRLIVVCVQYKLWKARIQAT